MRIADLFAWCRRHAKLAGRGSLRQESFCWCGTDEESRIFQTESSGQHRHAHRAPERSSLGIVCCQAKIMHATTHSERQDHRPKPKPRIAPLAISLTLLLLLPSSQLVAQEVRPQ